MNEVFRFMNLIDHLEADIRFFELQRENTINRKEEVFKFVHCEDGESPIVLNISKEQAVRGVEEKLCNAKVELRNQKAQAVKAMQRLIEEWTSTK